MLLPNISKYVIETSVILGALFISALQFWFQDSRHAIASLSIFLAAGSRIAPALLRMQQGLMSIRLNLGFSDAALSIIKELDHNQRKFNNSTISKSQNSEFLIEVSNLKFRYQDESTDTIAVESLKIPKGSSVGIVGATGSGKSTFIDILMGMIPPTSGQVLISGLRPRDLLDMHPGYIGYVPQDIYIMDGTFRENITLGRMGPEIESKLQEVLRETQLDELVKSLSHGLETLVGSGGLSLSGGQKQRIGIARALLGEPSVLVLDESTSALDSESEQLIGQAIEKITSRTTVIMIAHRLSSIKSSNLVIYFENGKVRGSGTFNEVRNQISDFDKQAKLMGL
jgi:ABC-type multidrug transport system fused ATPase/permease subunit